MLDVEYKQSLVDTIRQLENDVIDARAHLESIERKPCCAHCIYWSHKDKEAGFCSRLEEDQIMPLTEPGYDRLLGYVTKATFHCRYFDGDKK